MGQLDRESTANDGTRPSSHSLTPTALHTQTSDPPGADAAGVHYPGIGGGNAALDFPMWSSEEASTYNNDVGGGCWARVVNQNYVANNMTASLCWNLVASYMKAMNW